MRTSPSVRDNPCSDVLRAFHGYQLSFADSEFNNKHRQTRKERFLGRMENLIPWQRLESVIESSYAKADNNRISHLASRISHPLATVPNILKPLSREGSTSIPDHPVAVWFYPGSLWWADEELQQARKQDVFASSLGSAFDFLTNAKALYQKLLFIISYY